jgi:hypothetical protein
MTAPPSIAACGRSYGDERARAPAGGPLAVGGAERSGLRPAVCASRGRTPPIGPAQPLRIVGRVGGREGSTRLREADGAEHQAHEPLPRREGMLGVRMHRRFGRVRQCLVPRYRMAALAAAAAAKRRHEPSTEDLEIHRRADPLPRIALRRQVPKAILNILEPRLTCRHPRSGPPSRPSRDSCPLSAGVSGGVHLPYKVRNVGTWPEHRWIGRR